MAHIRDYKGKNVHLIGIGGCSMNGLAQMLFAQGYNVRGSDRSASPFTERLGELGINAAIGHAADNVEGADIIVYSAAIKPDNPERARARELGLPELERSVVLGQLSEQYGKVIGISGCHGKTTITSMLALISEKAGLGATVHVGGFVDFLQGGTVLGNNDLLITEACEYVDSFLTLSPSVILLNNIDDDHLDYFADIEAITDSFRRFIALLPKDGLLIGCVDDERVAALCDAYPGPKISYGLSGGDYTAADIRAQRGQTLFTLVYKGAPLYEVTLNVPGRHNVLNALGAIAVARHLGAGDAAIREALGAYTLTRRRFEYYGDMQGAHIYHDYAHHPAEIAACLEGARSVADKKVYAVFQCNSYTRAKTLFSGTLTCFADADEVLVPDIYPGRDIDRGEVHARDMVAAIGRGGGNAQYIATFAEIRDYLKEHLQKDDLVVTLGSGDVYIQSRMFVD